MNIISGKFAIMSYVTLVLLAPVAASAEVRSLKVVGTGDGVDLLRQIGDAFSADHSDVRVEIPPSIGSGGGIAAVGGGKASLGRIARALSETERASQIIAHPLARIASAIFIHRSADVSALTSAQVADVFNGNITNWKDVGGADLRIRVVRREDEDSTLGALRAYMPGWRGLVITEKSKMAATTQESIESVRETPGAVGFGPFSSALPRDLVVLKIDGRMPVDTGYPAHVELSLIHRSDASDADARTFVAFTATPKVKALIKSFGAEPAAK